MRGEKPERWVRQTDFTNDEAVGYLADRLARLGVEDALRAAGAEPGDEVVIGGDGGVVFDWEPTLTGRRRAPRRQPARHRPAARGRADGDARPRSVRRARIVVKVGLVVADQRPRRRHRRRPAVDALVDALAERAAGQREVVLVSSGAIAAGLRAAAAAPRARATSPPSRPRRASARACSCTGTPRRSRGTAVPSARCCSPPTTSSAARTTATR